MHFYKKQSIFQSGKKIAAGEPAAKSILLDALYIQKLQNLLPTGGEGKAANYGEIVIALVMEAFDGQVVV